MRRPLRLLGVLLAASFLLGEAGSSAAWGYNDWVVRDDYGYARSAPCQRATAYAACSYCSQVSGRRAHLAPAPGRCTICYPPLRPAATINTYDRPEELNWSW